MSSEKDLHKQTRNIFAAINPCVEVGDNGFISGFISRGTENYL